MYYSQLEAYKIRLRILENYVLIPHFPQKKGRFVCLSLLKQANRSFILQGCLRQT